MAHLLPISVDQKMNANTQTQTPVHLLPSKYSHYNQGLLQAPDLYSQRITTSPPEASSFSHDIEARVWGRNRLYKTKVCRYFLRGKCKFGAKCSYAHRSTELQARPDFYKTKMCNKPDCASKSCPFAHSIYELRDPPNSVDAVLSFEDVHRRTNDVNCPTVFKSEELQLIARFECEHVAHYY